MRQVLIAIFILIGGFLLDIPANAVEVRGLAMSITPPLIKNNVSPGEIWKTQIKFVNNGGQNLDIYVSVADFRGGKENGTVEFIKDTAALGEEESGRLLSRWIVIDPGPINIPAYQSREIPVIIDVPEEAGPGGHYAAILAGTKPPSGEISGSNIKISSLLASLILLNIKGDVKEDGRIREFSADRKFYSAPEVNFTVRFENTGNVHIQPQGEIKIFNFFNEEAGKIEINHRSEFGNVLPAGIRKWAYGWSGKRGFLEMGRYRAELTLTYGEDGRKTVDQKLFFWVIHVRPLMIAAGSVLFMALLLVLFIRRYVRKSILATQARIGAITERASAVAAPGKAAARTEDKKRRRKAPGKTVKIIVIAVPLLLLASYLVFSRGSEVVAPSIVDVTEEAAESDNAEVEIVPAAEETREETDAPAVMNDDDALPEDGAPTASSAETATGTGETAAADSGAVKKEDINIKVLNGGGRPGVAGELSAILEAAGFKVNMVGNADNFNYADTIIRYRPDFAGEAGEIDGLITSPVKAEERGDLDADIVVIAGKNYK